MRRILTAILFVYAIVLAQTTSAQINDVDVSAVQIVRPVAVTVSENPHPSRTWMDRFGIRQPSNGYSIGAGENPNLIYKRARPFPEMELVSDAPFSPSGGPTTHVGVQRIDATRLRWPWPPPNRESVPESEKQTLWHWNVPKALQTCWWTEAPSKGADRHWALCLYSGIYTSKPPSDIVDPQLFYFDTLSGLRWQTTIPVHRALQDVATSPDGSGDDTEVMLGVTADGSRVLALVSRSDKQVSLLCVFDGSGKLLRTLRFPGYTAMQSGFPHWQLLRSPSGRTHIIMLRHHSDSNRDAAIGVDPEGSLSARFVSDEGKSVQIMVLTDKYAVAERQRPDGHYWQYIYKLLGKETP